MSERVCGPEISERSTATLVSGLSRGLQPLFGRLLVLLTLPTILPVMAVIALAVRLGSPGPVILRLNKVNAAGRAYQEYRFRCVWIDARARQFRHDLSGTVASERDVRVTPVGAFLLRSGLNTLPQLFNVLKGDVPLRLQGRD